MKFDFSNEEFFDNHTHLLYKEAHHVSPEEFALNYHHGILDHFGEDGKRSASDTVLQNLPFQTVVRSLLNAMAERFDIEPTIKAATELRNSMTETAQGLQEYGKLLFEDQKIVGCMLDSDLPMGHPDTQCFPCEVFRLFQYEKVFFSAVKEKESYDDVIDEVLGSVRQAKQQGFVALKGHIAERFGFDIHEVSDETARLAFPKAKGGDQEALRKLYYAMFSHLLELCAELDMSIHLHTGTTGFKKNKTKIDTWDPLLMAPFLNDRRYLQTKIVLLHGSFPYTRSAGWMAYNFPNVYIDLSQTQLWQPALAETLMEEALCLVPHNKILMGSGQHKYCEMAWLTARNAKKTLAFVMEKLVSMGIFSFKQAEETAHLMLSGNALRLYHY